MKNCMSLFYQMMKKIVYKTNNFSRFILGVLFIGCAFNASADQGSPDISWSIYKTVQPPKLVGLNKIFMTSPDSGWIGIYSHADIVEQPLYRLKNGELIHDASFRFPAHRTFVMDGLSENHFWVYAYSPRDSESREKSASLAFYNGEAWQYFDMDWLFAKCMDVVEKNNVWIGFNGGGILNFKKEGNSWKKNTYILKFPGDKTGIPHVYGIKASQSGQVWAAGCEGLVAHYKNDTWEVIDMPPELNRAFFKSVDVCRDGSAWFAAEKGKIARYHQGKWKIFETGTTNDLNAIQMLSPDEGWCVGKKGTILYYKKGAWTSRPSPSTDTFYDIQMTNTHLGWILGGSSILRATGESQTIFNDVSLRRNDSINQISSAHLSAVDIDRDGDPDLYLSNGRLFENDGQGIFTDISVESGLPVNEDAYTEALFSWGDFDRDRNPDLFVLSDIVSQPNLLFLNRGKVSFIPSSFEKSITSGGGPHSTASSVDYDNDGDIDIFINRRFEESQVPAVNYLYENKGYGDFEKKVLTTEKILSYLALWGDLNGDSYPDLILTGKYTVFLNDRRGNLVKYPESFKDYFPKKVSIQNLLFDEDLDGDLDLFTVTDYPMLFRNNGKGFFDPAGGQILFPVEKSTNYSDWLCKAGDIDNDGYPELFFIYEIDEAQRLVVLKRLPGGRYENISVKLGLSGIHATSLELQDFDHDGDLDFYAVISDSRNIHLENRTNTGKNAQQFFMIKVHGIKSNTMGLGTKIKIYTAGHLGEINYLKGHKQVGLDESGRSTGYPGYQHFGLPGEGAYDIEVTFPTGRRVQRLSVESGVFLDIYEYPFFLRLVYSVAERTKRAAYYAHPVIEICKLLLILILLLLVRYYVCPKLGGTLFMAKWVSLGKIVIIYGITMVYASGYSLFVTHIFPLLEVVFLIIAGLTIDRLLWAVKNAYFLGPYRLKEKIGEGGMGVVYRAKNIVSRKTVALKVLHPGVTGSEENKLRFSREGKLMEQLDHENIVKVFETGSIGEKGYISMEFLRGKTLGAIIKELGKLDLYLVIQLLLPLCDALGYIHEKGIIHRDIKSDNILLPGISAKSPASSAALTRAVNSPKDNAAFPVKLMDFGLAKNASMMTMTRHAGLMGTVVYMSPEQAQGRKPDNRSDIFSLGVVMYEALTGTLPFSGDHELAVIQSIINEEPEAVSAYVPGFPEKADAVLTGILAKVKDERPGSVWEVKKMLSSLLVENSEEIPGGQENIKNNTNTAWGNKGYPGIEKSIVQNPAYFLRDHKSRDDFRVSKITGLTDRWLKNYRLSLEMMEQDKKDSVLELMAAVIDQIHEVMFYLDDDEKMVYLEKHNIDKVLEFWETIKEQA